MVEVKVIKESQSNKRKHFTNPKATNENEHSSNNMMFFYFLPTFEQTFIIHETATSQLTVLHPQSAGRVLSGHSHPDQTCLSFNSLRTTQLFTHAGSVGYSTRLPRIAASREPRKSDTETWYHTGNV